MRKVTRHPNEPGKPADLALRDFSLFILPSAKECFELVNKYCFPQHDYLEFKKEIHETGCGYEIHRTQLAKFYSELYVNDPLRMHQWEMDFYPDHSIYISALNLGVITRKQWSEICYPNFARRQR
jgi:hypothetical protein